MTPLKRLWLLPLFILWSQGSLASEISLRTEVQETNSFLGFGAESSNFRLDTGSISGSGVKVDFNHFFNSKMSFQVYLASGFGGSGNLSSNYTGLGGSVSYSLLGNCCTTERLTSVGGQPALIENYPFRSSLNIGVGMDQYMLYGESAMYSASGAALLTNYQFSLLKNRWKVEGKTSFLSVNSKQILGLSLGLSILFPI